MILSLSAKQHSLPRSPSHLPEASLGLQKWNQQNAKTWISDVEKLWKRLWISDIQKAGDLQYQTSMKGSKFVASCRSLTWNSILDRTITEPPNKTMRRTKRPWLGAQVKYLQGDINAWVVVNPVSMIYYLCQLESKKLLQANLVLWNQPIQRCAFHSNPPTASLFFNTKNEANTNWYKFYMGSSKSEAHRCSLTEPSFLPTAEADRERLVGFKVSRIYG